MSDFDVELLIGEVRDYCTIVDTLIDVLVRPERRVDGQLGWKLIESSEEDIDALVCASILAKNASRDLHKQFHRMDEQAAADKTRSDHAT